MYFISFFISNFHVFTDIACWKVIEVMIHGLKTGVQNIVNNVFSEIPTKKSLVRLIAQSKWWWMKSVIWGNDARRWCCSLPWCSFGNETLTSNYWQSVIFRRPPLQLFKPALKQQNLLLYFSSMYQQKCEPLTRHTNRDDLRETQEKGRDKYSRKLLIFIYFF
jgi:hypothetical protein